MTLFCGQRRLRCDARPVLQWVSSVSQRPPQTLVDHHLEGTQGGTECVLTMEVNGTNYRQPDALIPGHLAVTDFFWGQGRKMNYREGFNTVKQAKAFCQEHFNGLDLQAVYHPREQHCATGIWGGRAKGVHVCIIKALSKLFQVQSQMHAQQGTNMLMGTTMKRADITRAGTGPGHLMCCLSCLICHMMVRQLLWSCQGPPPVHPDINRSLVRRQQWTWCSHNP
jgi:hypothetical protein